MDIEHVPWTGYGVTAERIESARCDLRIGPRVVLPADVPIAPLSRYLADRALHQMTPAEIADDATCVS